jgi:hypothetical protein
MLSHPKSLTFVIIIQLLTLSARVRASEASRQKPLWPLLAEFPYFGNYFPNSTITGAEEGDACRWPVYLGFISLVTKAIITNDVKKLKAIREKIELKAKKDSTFARNVCLSTRKGLILECRAFPTSFLDYGREPPEDSEPFYPQTIYKCRCFSNLNFRTFYDEDSETCKADRGSPCNEDINKCWNPKDSCVGKKDLKTAEYCTCQRKNEFEESIVMPRDCFTNATLNADEDVLAGELRLTVRHTTILFVSLSNMFRLY